MVNGAFLLISCFFMPVTSAFSQTSDGKSKKIETVDGKKYYMHTVEKNQTLYAISKLYGMEVNDIVMENPEAIDGIKPSQVLKVPFSKPRKPVTAADTSKAAYAWHKVEQGQTLYSIAKLYAMKEEAIVALNPSAKAGLKAGQLLKLPLEKKGNVTATQPGNRPGATVNTDTAAAKAWTTMKKEVYNVALFLPFHAASVDLIDVDKIAKGFDNFPAKMGLAAQFYQGALMAVDSLKKLNLAVRLHVFDIDDSDSMKMVQMLKKPDLTSMDLIIGPLFTSGFVPVSKYALDHRIPVVSPLSQLNKILFNNVQVSKVTPSVVTQLEQAARFIADTFHKANIILVNNSIPKEASYVNAYRKSLKTELQRFQLPAADSVKEVKNLAGVSLFLSSTKVNIVIIPSNSQSYVTEMLRKLNEMAEKNRILVFGMSSWNGFDNLDIEYLNTLQLHYPHYFHVDYTTEPARQFIRQYRAAAKTEPGIYVYHGFDIMYYYLNALKKYGTGFNQKLPENQWEGVQTGFSFYQPVQGSGYENKHVYILKYRDYKLVRAN